MKIIKEASEINVLATQVESSEGLVFVPAFNGLFAPHWRSDSRGLIMGLTQFHTSSHLCRSALEAIALQVNDVLEVMAKESGCCLKQLKVDGGVSNSEVLLQ